MKRKVLREYYELAANELLKTAKGKGFKVIYVDPDASTDSTFNNKDLMKKYGMEYLPYNRYIRNVQGVPKAWGWIIWDGSEQEVYPLIRKFAEEIGSQETPPDNGSNRTVEEVLASIEQLKDVIMKAQASGQVRIDGNGIIANAEEFKKKLAQGVGSRETMEALAELTRFRIEMSKHRGHQLSLLNTILIFLQKGNATDVRSKGEWREMGYTPKPDATQIVLAMPASFKKLFGAQYDEVVRRFLEKEGVKAISELTPSQKRRLDRETKYPDPQGFFANKSDLRSSGENVSVLNSSLQKVLGWDMADDVIITTDNNVLIIPGLLFQHLTLSDFQAVSDFSYHLTMFSV